MKYSPSTFYNLLGREVVERYGRYKGKVVGLELSPEGEVKGIVFENNGVIIFKGIESIKVLDKYIEVAPPSIVKAENIISKLNFLKFQYEIIRDNISNTYSINNGIYSGIKIDLDETYNKLTLHANSILKSLEDRKKSLEARRDSLFKVFFSLDLAKRIKIIDDEKYVNLHERLESELFKLNREIEDIELLIAELSIKLKEIDEIKNGIISGEDYKVEKSTDEKAVESIENQSSQSSEDSEEVGF